ncbi:MAG: class F sortase [Oscillospiraceae bacterium]|nr:class F sortase [Oscillospiraceae bacterium]
MATKRIGFFCITAIMLLMSIVGCGARIAANDNAEIPATNEEIAESSIIVALPSDTDADEAISPDPPEIIEELNTPDEPPSPEPEPEPERELIESWPVWMYIPKLNVDAEIVDTGTDYEADTMEIYPSGTVISWWRESSIPGNMGNAIFGGHNKWSGANGQLLLLDTLDIGDEMVIVYEDESSLTFNLESVFVYALATAPADVIMDVRGEPRVTIITCKEPFNPNTGTSDNRIIAIFKLESDFVFPDPPIEPFPLREK